MFNKCTQTLNINILIMCQAGLMDSAEVHEANFAFNSKINICLNQVPLSEHYMVLGTSDDWSTESSATPDMSVTQLRWNVSA